MKILFIPCYNCENQISRVIHQLSKNKVDEIFDEILIVDNKSDDNTVSNAIHTIEAVRLSKCIVVQNSMNVGLGGSHKMAFRYSKERNAKYIAVLHGDDQGDIRDLLKLIQNNDHEKFDCCLGSRFSAKSKLEGYSKFRIFGNYVFNIIFSFFSRKKIMDLGAGINIYKVEAISDQRINQFANDLTFNCYLLLFSIREKQTIKYFPITWKEEDQVSNVKLFSQSINTMKIILSYCFFGIDKFQKNNIDFEKISFIKKYE